MTKLEIKGDRNIIKGKLKQKWTKLTDDDLQYAEGKQEELIGRIQKRTGETREAVEKAVKDSGAYGLICVQGSGKINGQPLNSPKLIRFHELTEDEYFCTEDGAKNGVTFENTSETEPLVTLRYFGPEVNPDAPAMGAYRKNKF